ncbi:MAG: NAD(+) synthase [Lentisphaerae bacterium]|nr:NAD(+) synthase [Lentisphaerota bacterium]
MKKPNSISAHPFGEWCEPEEVFRVQSTSLVVRLSRIGVKSVTIGLSGGLDSTLCLLVAVSAFKKLRLPKNGIRVYSMPGFGTTDRTKGNAELLCDGLGLKLESIDITKACLQHFMDIGHNPEKHDVTYENVQARMRTMVLMNKANMTGGIVLGTGDMSEIALGWSTYNGDHMSMFGVNAGVPKTVVRDVCRWWAEMMRKKGRKAKMAADAVFDILDTPVSPELLPAKDGQIVQRTEDRIGPYELHDFFIWRTVVCGERRRSIRAAAKRAFKGVYSEEVIDKWLEVFCRRLVTQAFKRNCAPDGIKVFPAYFGPDDWHIPSDCVYRGDIIQPNGFGER